jgi:hypothetical protein
LLGPTDQRLEFPLSEWRSAGTPIPGQIVDFVEDAGQARAVFAVPNLSGARSQSSSMVLSAIALGCLALGFVIPLLPTIAALVLGVIGAGQARTEGDESALLMARIAWIGAVVMLAIGILAVLAVFTLLGAVGFSAVFHGLGPMDF